MSVKKAVSNAATAGEWTTWGMTQVIHRRGDPWSRLFGLSSIGPVAILVFLAGMASAPTPRRVPALVLLIFLLCSSGFNAILKAIFRMPRPVHPMPSLNHVTSHGMPSDHAQFISFFVSYLVRRALARGMGPVVLTPKYALLFGAVVAIVAYGRVYNLYHTVPQIAVGIIIGALTAVWATTPAVQETMTSAVERVVLPVLLWCTGWAQFLE